MKDEKLSPEERREAREKLARYFAKVDAGRLPVSEAEEDAIITEALRSTRPNYGTNILDTTTPSGPSPLPP